MKIKLSTLRNAMVMILLVVLGAIAGYKYALQEKPFNFQLPFLNTHQRTSSATSSLAKLTNQTDNDQAVDFSIFWETWSLLERDYLDQEKLDPGKMVDGAVSGMTAAIGDPYTMYLPPVDNQRSGESLAGSFYGIGVELGYVDGTLAVVAPIDGTPAAVAGLKAGDLILHVKDQAAGLDEDTAGWSLDEAVNKIRGAKDSEVILTIYTQGQENSREVALKRGEIIVETVVLKYLDQNGKKIAHLRVNRFGGRTKDEWDEAVDDILANKNQIQGIILDLRNNPGGYFDTSIDLASDFISEGVVVSQKGKVTQEDFQTLGTARLKNFSTVVLVNKGSASAAEIVAGALHDDRGIKLIGEQTFGKGTVQDRRELSNGGGLHVTIGRWLLPSGAWIHDEGIAVDVAVEDNADTEADEVLQKGLELLK